MTRHDREVADSKKVTEALQKLLTAVRRFDDKYYHLLETPETELMRFMKEKLQASIARRTP